MEVLFNKKRTLRQYIAIIKYFLTQSIKHIPYRLSARLRKKPDFLIIGVMKGGTTSLYDWLNQHPDIQMSRTKEVNYFSKYYYNSMLHYRSFFCLKKINKLAGEASPYYFFHPHVPSRVKKDLPKAKIILLLRDPVYRAYSHYQMVKGIDCAIDFNEALELESSRIGILKEKFEKRPYYFKFSHEAYSYKSKGLYFEQLSNWLKYYKKEDILFIKSEDLFENTEKELLKIYDYLGVEKIFPTDLSAKNQRNYNMLSKDEYQKYQKLFQEDSEKLKELLGNHFSWKYDRKEF